MADLSELGKHQNYHLLLARPMRRMATDVNIINVLVSNWLRFSTGNTEGAILARDFKASGLTKVGPNCTGGCLDPEDKLSQMAAAAFHYSAQ